MQNIQNDLKIPFKVGDIVYYVYNKDQLRPIDIVVDEIKVVIRKNTTKIYLYDENGDGGNCHYAFKDLNKAYEYLDKIQGEINGKEIKEN